MHSLKNLNKPRRARVCGDILWLNETNRDGKQENAISDDYNYLFIYLFIY